MPGGERVGVGAGYVILDRTGPLLGWQNNRPLDPEEESPFVYSVGSTDGTRLANVDVTPVARVMGEKGYTRLTARTIHDLPTTVEHYEHPPLVTEEKRQQAALNLAQIAMDVSRHDLSSEQ